MKLRWFTVFNKDGLNGQTQLQYWDEEAGKWEEVPSVRVPEKYEYHAMVDEDWE